MSQATKPDVPPADDDLARLLAAEQRLERLVADARAEAARIVAAATTAAVDSDRVSAAELDRDARESAARLKGEAARRETDILAEGQAMASRFDSVPADRIAAIARRLSDALVAPA